MIVTVVLSVFFCMCAYQVGVHIGEKRATKKAGKIMAEWARLGRGVE